MKKSELDNYCIEVIQENGAYNPETRKVKRKMDQFNINKNEWIPNPCGNLFVSDVITSDDNVSEVILGFDGEEPNPKEIRVRPEEEMKVQLVYGKPNPYFLSECTFKIKEKVKDNPKVFYL